MPFSTTWQAIADRLFTDPGLMAAEVDARFAYKFTAATVAANSLTTTDANIVKLGTEYVSSRFQGWHVYLFTAAQSFTITSMSITGQTATLNFVGGTATVQAGATTAYLLRCCSWAELRSAADAVLEYLPVENFIPLAHGPDSYDLQDSDVVDTDWTETDASDTPQTTAAEVFMGARSLVVTASVANGYTQSSTMRVGHNAQVAFFAIVKSDIGTSELVLFSSTSVELAKVATVQEDWMFLKKLFTVSSTVEGVFLRLREVANLDSGDWQFAWMVKQDERMFKLPATVDERFKVKGIARGIFLQSGDEADTWMAESMDLERLRSPEDDPYEFDYRFIGRQADANPYWIHIEPHIRLDEPLFLILEANYANPYGVAFTFSADTSLFIGPPHLLTARLKQWIGQQYGDLFPALAALGAQEYRLRSRVRAPVLARTRQKTRFIF